MNITGPIIALLASNTPANGLLAGRVYPGVLKQSTTYPAAAINVTDNTPHASKTDPSNLDRVLVQIDVYGDSPTSSADTAEAIRAALEHQSTGTLMHIEYKREITGFSEKPELHRRILEFTVMLRR